MFFQAMTFNYSMMLYEVSFSSKFCDVKTAERGKMCVEKMNLKLVKRPQQQKKGHLPSNLKVFQHLQNT